MDGKKMTEEKSGDDIDRFFTPSQLENMSDYEKLRYRNMKKNYEMMVKLGLPAQKPEFMDIKKLRKQKQIWKDSESDDEWKPSSEKKRPAKKPKFLNAIKKKKKSKMNCECSDSEEEWRPGSGTLAKKKGKKIGTESKRTLRKTTKIQSESQVQSGSESESKDDGKPRYPQRKLPTTNYMYLEVPDDDEFIYCDDCEREYEGDCPVHPTSYICDTMTLTKTEQRAMETLPEGLFVRQSGIPNAGFGVWADKAFPNRCSFGPYQGEIIKDSEKAHSTGYAWQVYVDGVANHFIDAYDKSKSNWMRYVNCARNEDEQNLIAFQYKGDIYYRSFKEIAPNTELLVWYGQDYGKDLGIERVDVLSLLKPRYINGEEIYSCSLCKTSFSYERYLYNHLKHRHGTKLEWLLNPFKDITIKNSRWQCHLCQKDFGSQLLVLQHYRFIHQKNMEKIQFSKEAYTKVIHSNLSEIKSDRFEEGAMDGCIKDSMHKEDICNGKRKKVNQREQPAERRNIYRVASDTSGNSEINCKTISNSVVLQAHAKSQSHREDQPYKCSVCVKRFGMNGDLQTHMKTHTGDKPYKFIQSVDLQTHIGTHTGCKGFSQCVHLQTHIRTHTGEKLYKCDVCDKGFSDNSAYNRHIRAHTGDKPYRCDVCGKGFTVSKNLQRHIRTHTGDKPYKCGVCGKAFSDNSAYIRHIRTHTGDKPYKCDVCGKGFSQSGDLQRHIRTHTGEKPYKCDVCGKGFNRSGFLQTHIRTHTGEKPYKCDVCGKGFNHSSNLRNHIRIHTGDKPYKCDVCGKGFSQSGDLQRHIRTHTGEKPYKCDVCGKGFNQSGPLQTHIRTHTGEKPYKCDVCGKGFNQSSNLQTHIRTHTGDRPYKCDVCGKGFSDISAYNSHNRTHNK